MTTYQVGANVGNTISVNLTQGVGANQIGAVASTTTAVSNAATTGVLQLAVGNCTGASRSAASSQYATDGKHLGRAYAYQDATSAYAKASAINGAGFRA